VLATGSAETREGVNMDLARLAEQFARAQIDEIVVKAVSP
jgi:hypothetical protein